MLFPKWANQAPMVLGGVLTLGLVGVVTAFAYYISPYNTQVGYAPEQPVPYSHKLHAGDLGMDCLYCHVGVETSPSAVVPPTATCMNCHSQIKAEAATLLPVRESYATDEPVEWIRIHRLPEFAYFDHSVHVNAGVGCETCHGRIDQMEVVFQAQPLSMGWCLDCHRAPEKFLRPRGEVTTMGYEPPGDQIELGLQLKSQLNIHPTEDCSGCHR